MERYINILAKQILRLSGHQIAKVRFAKIIYFVHKNLVKEGIEKSNNLAFIRMPLGPVADGFLELVNDPAIMITVDNIGLVYNREKYGLTVREKSTQLPTDDIVKKALLQLAHYSTSQLINMSHLDPSWQKHINGDHYYISEDDLSNTLPTADPKALVNRDIDDQLIQSQLLGGMIEDSIQDSTSLEHPQYYS